MQAQDAAAPSFPNDVYCSGLVSTSNVPTSTFVITGEESSARLTYTLGDTIYINKGSDEGAKVGDEFSLVRAEQDPSPIEWTKWQDAIFRKMGTLWVDLGRAKVVQVLPQLYRGDRSHVRYRATRRYCCSVYRGAHSYVEANG
jgi:hypothetical protein